MSSWLICDYLGQTESIKLIELKLGYTLKRENGKIQKGLLNNYAIIMQKILFSTKIIGA